MHISRQIFGYERHEYKMILLDYFKEPKLHIHLYVCEHNWRIYINIMNTFTHLGDSPQIYH